MLGCGLNNDKKKEKVTRCVCVAEMLHEPKIVNMYETEVLWRCLSTY